MRIFFARSTCRFLILLAICLSGSKGTAYGQPADTTSWLSLGDSAYAAGNNQLAMDHYRQAISADPQNDEAAWKFARALIDIGETLEDKETRKSYFTQARDAAQKSVDLDKQNSKGYLFLSVSLGRVALDAGPRERIKLAKAIKKAVDQALALDPTDDIAWHVLGRWHHKISTLSWIERRFANIFLGGVPKEASIDSALTCFIKATALRPHIIAHQFELGNVHLEMNNSREAAKAYRRVLELTPRDPQDADHRRQASTLLQDLEN